MQHLQSRDAGPLNGEGALLPEREVERQRGVALSPECLTATKQLRDVLDRLSADDMLSAAARSEASALRAAYPSDAELLSAAVAGNALFNWGGMFLRCRRMMDVLVLFEQGTQCSQTAMATFLRKFGDLAIFFAADSECPPHETLSTGGSE